MYVIIKLIAPVFNDAPGILNYFRTVDTLVSTTD